MLDPSGHSDNFVVPNNATAQQVVDLWRRVIDAPDNVGIVANSGDGEIFHWGYATAEQTISYSISTPLKR
jgi:hypothetical protein